MVKRILVLAVTTLMFFTLQAAAGQPAGVTGTVFNKRFIPNIRPMMSYDQIVRITGAQGAKVGESKAGSTSVSSYRWNGGRGSVLNVRLAGGKLVDATIKAPNGHTYAIGRDGKVSDLGD